MILVSLGYYNKITQTGECKQQKYICSQFWQLKSLTSGYQLSWFLMRSLLLDCRYSPSCHVFTWPFLSVCPYIGRLKEISLSSPFYDFTNLIMRSHPQDLI